MPAAKNYQAIILAGGKGTRLKSNLPKVLHDILGKSVLQRCLETLTQLSTTAFSMQKVYIVVGYQAEVVQKAIEALTWPFEIEFVIQEPQLGTGHAVQQVAKVFDATPNTQLLITCGDTPCIPLELFKHCLEVHDQEKLDLTVASCKLDNPGDYGRVLFDTHNNFEAIVEAKDASEEIKKIKWINTGIYVANWEKLNSVLGQLTANNAQKEYYLTDVALLLKKAGHNVGVCKIESADNEASVLGINSRADLSRAIDIFSHRKIKALMQDGITIIKPETVTIAPEVTIDADSTIYPNTYLVGNIQIGSNCHIGPNTTLQGEIIIGKNCTVGHSYLQNTVTIGDKNSIGPFAHIRDNTTVGSQCRIGNFVEIKQSKIGNNTNAAHLSYLGDATIGHDVNMGAGSIIANYDPIRDQKHETMIENNVKVGCNSTLIAPVTIGESACIAAGSTITKNVSTHDLAIARSHQSVIPKWVKKKQLEKAKLH